MAEGLSSVIHPLRLPTLFRSDNTASKPLDASNATNTFNAIVSRSQGTQRVNRPGDVDLPGSSCKIGQHELAECYRGRHSFLGQAQERLQAPSRRDVRVFPEAMFARSLTGLAKKTMHGAAISQQSQQR